MAKNKKSKEKSGENSYNWDSGSRSQDLQDNSDYLLKDDEPKFSSRYSDSENSTELKHTRGDLFPSVIASDPVSNEMSDRLDGTDKKKVAPRSGLQFKVGPSFETTTLFKPIYLMLTDENVFPFVNARIDRGFDFINGEWIGYKRNYFTLVAAFEFEDQDNSIFSNEKFYTIDAGNQKVSINCFALRLVSKCCEDDMQINLVQHTAKRDRGPQFKPPVYPAVTGVLPSHQVIKQAANIRNESKIDQFNKLFFLDNAEIWKTSDKSILHTYPPGKIATVARYERIQFSTSINYRKPTMVNRHFTLQVELLGLLSDGNYTILASTETPPLIVRGRSPSNYQIAKMNARNVLEKQKIDPIFKFLSNKNYGNENPKYVHEDDENDDIINDNISSAGNIAPAIEKRLNRSYSGHGDTPCFNNAELLRQPKKRGRKKGSKLKVVKESTDRDRLSGVNFALHHVPQESSTRSASLNDRSERTPRSFNDSDDRESNFENYIHFVAEDEPLQLSVDSPLNQFSLHSDYSLVDFMEPAVLVKRAKKSKSKSTHSKRKKSNGKYKQEKLPHNSDNGSSSFFGIQQDLNLDTELRGEYSNHLDYVSEYIV
ncbi:uncharacterized protein PRCAT00001715001 [Priceomyces carsonii]|uniref:uncharacterized protein n=1 Tax=Priceomyces carsonii TaxID=28549 RepID=UPI002ED7F1BB|nr:unnamed protein product [Priceomyces carsonii]